MSSVSLTGVTLTASVANPNLTVDNSLPNAREGVDKKMPSVSNVAAANPAMQKQLCDRRILPVLGGIEWWFKSACLTLPFSQ